MNDLLPAKDKFIQAAADLSGRDPGQLDAQEAIHILQEYDREPQGDLYRQLTDDAARELFSDPEAAQEWQKITGELWDGEMPDLLALALQRDLTPLIMKKAKALRDDLPQDDPKRQQAEQILNAPLLSQEAQEKLEYTREIIEIVREAIRPAVEGARQVAEQIQEVVNATAEPRRVLGEVFKQWNDLREAMAQFMESNPAFLLYSEATGELSPYIEAELKKPEYGGKTLEDIWNEAGEQYDDGIFDDNSPLMQLVNAARAARDAEQADKEEPAPATALPSVKYTPAQTQQIQLNIDKLMRQMFNPRTADKAARGAVDLYIRDPAAGDYKPKRGEIPGQLSFFPVSYEKAGKEEITLYYALDYDEEMLKKLGLTGETTAEDYLIKNNPEIKLQKYDTYANAKNALENGNAAAWANDNTEVIAYALQNPGYTVGIPSLGSQDTIAPAVSKGNESLLNWINDEIKALAAENFFHKDYEATLVDTYGLDYEESLVVEGGVPAAAAENG